MTSSEVGVDPVGRDRTRCPHDAPYQTDGARGNRTPSLPSWRIVARYGKGKDAPRVTVEWREGDVVERYEVEPEHDEARVEALRI